MATNGGRRIGAGRKRKAEKYAGQITEIEDRIADRLPVLVQNMERLADGVWISELDPETGNERVYRKPPDRQANEYLINRIVGKPTEHHELSGADGEPLIPRDRQQAMLANPHVLELACQLDALISQPAERSADDAGAMGAPDE